MTTRLLNQDDPLDDFDHRTIALLGRPLRVYTMGSGPAVIVMTEMPGISPHVARFARWVRDAGFTVYLPSLFGADGAFPTTKAGGAVLQRACISKEFRVFADGGTSPIVDWLRALDREPEAVFVTHGEPAAAATFARRIEDELGGVAVVPKFGEVVNLLADGADPEDLDLEA